MHWTLAEDEVEENNVKTHEFRKAQGRLGFSAARKASPVFEKGDVVEAVYEWNWHAEWDIFAQPNERARVWGRPVLAK